MEIVAYGFHPPKADTVNRIKLLKESFIYSRAHNP